MFLTKKTRHFCPKCIFSRFLERKKKVRPKKTFFYIEKICKKIYFHDFSDTKHKNIEKRAYVKRAVRIVFIYKVYFLLSKISLLWPKNAFLVDYYLGSLMFLLIINKTFFQQVFFCGPSTILHNWETEFLVLYSVTIVRWRMLMTVVEVSFHLISNEDLALGMYVVF